MSMTNVKDEAARFRRLLMETIVLPGFLVCLVAALVIWLTVYLFDAIYWTQHSAKVISKISECRALTLDFETSKRGYLFNADSVFLNTHALAVAKLIPALNELRMRVCDNPDQVARVMDLKHTTMILLTSGEEQMQNRARGTPVDASRVLEDKSTMDSLRSKFDVIQQTEERLSAKRFERLHRAKLILIWLGSGLVISLAVVSSLFIRRQFNRLADYYRQALTKAALHGNELLEQKEWFRVTLLSIGEAVIMTDVGGRVVFMNPEAERMTGWMKSEAIRRPLADVFHIVHEETGANLINPVDEVLRDGRRSATDPYTILISKPDSQRWPIHETARPILDASGKLRGMVLVFHDATGPRQESRNLRDHTTMLEATVRERTERLSESVRKLEAFCYSISHDLRSPLRAMQGYAELILEEHSAGLDETAGNYVLKIKRAAERLNVLIAELLMFARSSGSKIPLKENLRSIVSEIIEPGLSIDAQKASPSESPPDLHR